MVEWKWVKWGSLFSVLFVGLQLGMTFNVRAAGNSDGFESVMSSSQYFKPAKNTDDPILNGVPLGEHDIELRTSAVLSTLTADHVVDGRVTTQTTQIKFLVKGRAALAQDSHNRITNARISLMTGDGKQQPVTEIFNNEVYSGSDTSVSLQKWDSYIVNVDFSKLSTLLPLHVGYQLKTTQDPDHWSSYYFGTFTTDGILAKPTIDDGLKPDSTQVTGTGIPGSVIRSDVNDATTEVDANGKYTLNLGSDLKNHLLAKPEITITQHNQFGDFSEASQKQLKMSKAENNPAFHIEDNLSYPEGTTDAEVMDDLRKRLEIQVDDEQLKVQYGSSKQNLAAFINSQAWGTTIAIPIYAKSPGYVQSNDIIVKITKKMENVIFTNQKSNLYFPNQPLPLNNTSIWSNDVWKLSVVDSRVIDQKRWTLTAIATESTKNSDKRDLSPFLWYVDGQQQQFPLDQLVTILDSRKTTPVSDVDGSKVYEQVFKAHDSGIIIKTDSRMSPGAYEATITWTLQMEAQD